MDQLSIVLTKFPFTDQIDYKIRPALIVSNTRFNKIHSFYFVCPITSKETLKEFELELNNANCSVVLKKKSYLRTDNIMSMEKGLFLKEIGHVTPQFFDKVKGELIKNF